MLSAAQQKQRQQSREQLRHREGCPHAVYAEQAAHHQRTGHNGCHAAADGGDGSLCRAVGRAQIARRRDVEPGKEVTDEIGGIGASTGEPLTLTVTGAYTCQVIPREDVKLTFKEGEKSRELSEFTDMTAGFRVTKDGNTITVTPVGGLSAVITAVTGKDASVGEYDDSADLFTLLIRSEDGKQTRQIHFGLYRYAVDGVRLSEKEIKF